MSRSDTATDDLLIVVEGDGLVAGVAHDGDMASADGSYAYAGYYGDASGEIVGDGFDYTGGDAYDYSGYYADPGAEIVGDGFEDTGEVTYDYAGYYDGSTGGIEGDGTHSDTVYAGYSITSTGDVNGDGFEDYLVEGYGSSYVLYGADPAELTVGIPPDFGDGVIRFHTTGSGGYGDGVVYALADGGGPDQPTLDGDGILGPAEEETIAGGPETGEVMYTQGDGSFTIQIVEWNVEEIHIRYARWLQLTGADTLPVQDA